MPKAPTALSNPTAIPQALTHPPRTPDHHLELRTPNADRVSHAPHNEPAPHTPTHDLELRTATEAPERIRRTRIRRLRHGLIQRLYGNGLHHLRAHAQRGAITAEYAVLIVGACGLGGVLVALLRSPAMQGALKAIINYGLKIAGVEGVHL